jgi:putative ABC transport system permease protein
VTRLEAIVSALLFDVKYAWRTLGRAPQFAAIVILTLALGIAANTSIFSVVYAVMLRPLPYPEPQQLVRITSDLRQRGATNTGVASQELFDYQSRTDVFSGVAGLFPANANVTGGDQPERVEMMIVSWNYFSILGVTPQLGRVFGLADNQPGIADVAVVSDGYWRRRLSADPQAIGRTLLLDGDRLVLVGVMPPGFRHPGRTTDSEVDVWAAAGFRAQPFAAPVRTRRFLQGALARLQPGVSVEEAQAALDVYAASVRSQFAGDYPSSDGWTPRVIPLQQDVTGNVAATMWILLSAVGLVLLIACVNVANLILARASERQQEIAMRRALGASHGRLARQMLTESAVLACAAGALGLIVAAFATDALVAFAPSRVAGLADVTMDGPVIAAAIVLAAITTVLFGVAPVWHLRQLSPYAVVKESAAGGSGSVRRTHVRHLLVGSEVALAMVLLVGAGLLARTVTALLSVPIGFDANYLVTARLWLPRPNDSAQGVYTRPDARVAFYRETLRRIDALPGVERAAMSNQIPMGGYNPPIFFELEAHRVGNARPVIHSFQVSPGYFDTMRIPVVRGRVFNEFDRADSEPVALISDAAARTFWGSDDPVGKRIRLSPDLPWMTIIGVAGDVQNRRFDEPPQPILYRSLEQSSNLALALLVRTRGDQPGIAEAIDREVRAVDPNLPVYAVRPMNDLLASAISQRQFLMRIVTAFGAAAIGLAVLGLYAVISYSVTQRTREIGIRVAMGARQMDVSRLVIIQGMRLAIGGMVVGVVAAAALSRFIRAQVFGVQPFDLVSVSAACIVMTLIAVIAIYLPARRASRVDPIVALRAER